MYLSVTSVPACLKWFVIASRRKTPISPYLTFPDASRAWLLATRSCPASSATRITHWRPRVRSGQCHPAHPPPRRRRRHRARPGGGEPLLQRRQELVESERHFGNQ